MAAHDRLQIQMRILWCKHLYSCLCLIESHSLMFDWKHVIIGLGNGAKPLPKAMIMKFAEE